MSLSKLTTRPVEFRDIEILDLFRDQFERSGDGRTDVPFGYSNRGVDTALVEREGKIIGATVATSAIIVDFIRNPKASGSDVYAAVLMGERILSHMASKSGLAAAYCAVPNHLENYLSMVRRSGYTEVFQNCKTMRRALAKEI
jgi:hypothetical protein